MKRKNYFFILTGAIVFMSLIALTGFYIYNKPVSQVATGTPAYELNSQQLLSDYVDDETAANEKYLGKVIEVTGIIQNITDLKKGESMTVMLNSGEEMSGVSCEIGIRSNPEVSQFHSGDLVTVRGICTGMLMDVVLTNCSIQKS